MATKKPGARQAAGAKKKTGAKKKSGAKRLDPRLLTTPLLALTVSELVEIGILKERSKMPAGISVATELSDADVKRVALAVAKLVGGK